jgi:hypothetical protein
MFNLLSEQLLLTSHLAARLGVHASAPVRWARTGIKTPHGLVRLEIVKVAGRTYTSEEAFVRFLQAQERKEVRACP